MTILDQSRKMALLDPQKMFGHVLDVPSHCQDARFRVLNCPPHLKSGKINNVVISGVGGSAIGGDVLRTFLGKTTFFPITVNRHYELPAWVTKNTLVICSSYSGNTEETLSVFRQALSKKLPLLIVSSGGALLKQAKHKKLPFCELPPGLQPRAAFGYSFITLLTALETSGFIPSFQNDFQEALRLLVDFSKRYHFMEPASRNQAKQLAMFFHNHIPVIYSGQDYFDSVSYRWKSQLNENAKQLALTSTIPEMNHNEILGYTFSEPLTKKMAVVLLRHPQKDHSQIEKRFDILKKLIHSKVFGIREVEARGNSVLAQMLSTIYLGDFVTVYLAYLKGVDPTPIDLIDQFKSLLSQAQKSAKRT